ncbi:hypothetical protein M0805_007425 [Coniferiporia weirii]|nr:hypothetical protein M0805_007425 [Coniferiporia weirii]
MRFRLTTKPPLKPLKAWFDLTDNDFGLDIFGVKSQICSRVPQSCDDGGPSLSALAIELSIDEFGLLDDSSAKVIRENDLVCISKKKDIPSQNKRKATNFYGSSDETSSSSEGSSTSESDSESDSDSDSDSTSSESSVEVQSSKKLHPAVSASKRKNGKAVLTVPPGEGKQSTHSRNVRRRLKRLHERVQVQGERVLKQALSSGSTNAVPLGVRKSGIYTQVGDSGVPRVMPSPLNAPVQSVDEPYQAETMTTTLRNKNKKKGFKRTMVGVIPQKIVFSDNNDVTPASTTSTSASVARLTSDGRRTQMPRLITPSEKQDQGLLPSNLFVTSVEVEGEKWDRKKKKKQRDSYGYNAPADAGDRSWVDAIEADGDLVLGYGEPDTGTHLTKTDTPGIDWSLVERKWDSFADITDISMLGSDLLVGWKALALDPLTFTPELLVHLARVKAINPVTSEITLLSVRRPGVDRIAFGADAEEAIESDIDDDGTMEEETIYALADALAAPWKLIKH